MRAVKSLALLFALLVLFPAAVFAQASIAGVVRDTSGAVLPGVTVEASSPALIERVRSVVTDGAGQYKILDLRPGIYAVSFTLTGFSTFKREGIELIGTFIAPVNAELRVGALTETITVTTETPVVDVQGQTRQRVFTQEVMEAIPAGRSHIDVMVLIPGMIASQPGRGTLADIGGTNNLQNTTFAIHGGRTSDTRLMVDGVRMGNVASPGEFTNFVPDMGSTQEVTVDYAGITAEQPYGGLRIDIIPREGGNTFRGTLFATAVNSAWQADNLTDELIARGLPTPNAMKRAYDINPSFGGPLLRDKLWFYSSVRFQQNQNYIAGLYYNQNEGDLTKWLYVPDTSRRAFFNLRQNSANGRVTWQPAQKHKLNFSFDDQTRVWDDTRAAVAPESAVAYRFPKLYTGLVGWSAPLTNRLLLEAKFTNHGEAFGNQPAPAGDVYRKLIPVNEQTTGLQYRGKGGDGGVSGTLGSTDQSINTVVTSMSYVTGAHALKIGFTDTWADTKSQTVSNDYNMYFRFNAGVPNQFTIYGTPSSGESMVKGEIGAYVQDRWTLKRTTFNVGIRYDQFIGAYPDQYLGPALYQPNRNITFPGTTGNNLRDITPRFGATYDLFGNGKTALKISVSKYVLATMPIGNPAGITNATSRTWTDANGNFMPDCVLTNMSPQDLRATGGDFCGQGAVNFGLPTSVATNFNTDQRFGWGHRLNNWEFSTSIQRQIGPRVGLDVGFFRRWFGNFAATDNRAVSGADYSPYSVTVPLDPRLPGGGGYVIGGLYNLNPDKSGLATDNWTSFSDDYGYRYEHWNGVDVNVNARLQNGLVAQGGLSVGRTTTDDCDLLLHLDNPSPLYCHTDTTLQPNIKGLATYTIKKPDMRVAMTFQSVPGPAVSANINFTNAQIRQSLGRDLSGNATQATVNVIEPGTMYGDRSNQLDVRISKLFRLTGARIAVNLDISNLVNASPVLQQNNTFAATTWQTPQRIMDGRMFKLGAQFDF